MAEDANDNGATSVADIQKITISEKPQGWSSTRWNMVETLSIAIGAAASVASYMAHKKDNNTLQKAAVAGWGVSIAGTLVSMVKGHSAAKAEKDLETQQDRVNDTLAIVKTMTAPDEGAAPDAGQQVNWQDKVNKEPGTQPTLSPPAAQAR